MPTEPNDFMEAIAKGSDSLMNHFQGVLSIDNTLTRQIVSFQGNKNSPFFRWYKYKEGFSQSLVSRFLSDVSHLTGKVLDPFAGAGTTLFTAAELGFDSTGIELLPLGQEVILSHVNCTGENAEYILRVLEDWKSTTPWKTQVPQSSINTLRITEGAYPEDTKSDIEKYISCSHGVDTNAAQVLIFALLCVLEKISYTVKDGQCLKWDHRARRGKKASTFNKGSILSFGEAIGDKLSEIISDMRSALNGSHNPVGNRVRKGNVRVIGGSCLDILETLPENDFDAIITSPPYCNRYDYTRTYALEHALLGISDAGLKELRQNMLSCTVESREKDLIGRSSPWKKAVSVCDGLPLLQTILRCMDDRKEKKLLNNSGIPRMVRGYFYEMACVIQECHRVLRPGGRLVLVNDNVRYDGVSIPVDTLLSKIAEDLGFSVKSILILPGSKGNSSQQMGKYGRSPLRKGVYVWEKPN